MKKFLGIIIYLFIITINTFCFADIAGGTDYVYIIEREINYFIILLVFLLVLFIIIFCLFQLNRRKKKNKESN